MKRIPLPGVIYPDALANGTYVAGAVTPGGPCLYTRIAPDGKRWAGVGNHNDFVYEWDGAAWQKRSLGCGKNAVIYAPTGELVINPPGCPYGTNGFRQYWNGRLIFGDETYGPFHGLSEYTQLAPDLWVGQAHETNRDEAVILHQTGPGQYVLRLLEPGPCKFIRADVNGQAVFPVRA